MTDGSPIPKFTMGGSLHHNGILQASDSRIFLPESRKTASLKSQSSRRLRASDSQKKTIPRCLTNSNVFQPKRLNLRPDAEKGDRRLNERPEIEPEVRFESILPNFVSKHVRTYLDTLTMTAGLPIPGGLQSATLFNENQKGPCTLEKVESLLKPVAMEGFAAVVMVDVSGYSNLTSVLAERGPVGAEILSRTMKVYMDKIIQLILTHGGDIVKFVGDAVLFYWKLDSGSADFADLEDQALAIEKGEIVLKACECCLELLTKLGSFEIDIPGCNIHVLKIHLGVGAGQIFDVHVGGDPGRWEHFIAGDAVHQLATVLDIAKAGELAVSHQALRWFKEVIDMASMDVGFYNKRCILLDGLEKKVRKATAAHAVKNELELWDVSEMTTYKNHHLYRKYINENAMFKLKSDINQSALFHLHSRLHDLMVLNELRQVTTVFIKVGSLKFETKDSLTETQMAMQAVQKALKRYEGTLRQFHVDDKGAVILVFFGLPPLAHENDASFGIKSSMEICRAFRRIFSDFSIGITTGVVSIGGVGNSVRTEYAVMGDSINMAARLMCIKSAKSSLLCDEKTFQLCEKEFAFESIGRVKVKGKFEPIQVYRPTGLLKKTMDSFSNSASLPNSRTIGREREKLSIEKALRRYERGLPVTFVLEAEQGLGLTTLVQEFKRRADEKEIFMCCGKGSELEKATPYFAFQELIVDFFLLLDRSTTNDEGDLIIPSHLKRKMRSEASDWNIQSLMSSFAHSTSSNSHMSENGSQSNFAHRIIAQLHEDKRSTIPTDVPGEAKTPPLSMHRSESNDQPRHIDLIIKRGIMKLGEPPGMVKLFDCVFPPTLENDNEHPPSIASTASGNLKSGLLEVTEGEDEFTSLLIRIINRVASRTKLIFLLHEAQFMEQVSWTLTEKLIAECPKVMFFLATRPPRQYPSTTADFLQSTRGNVHTSYVIVKSMRQTEIADLMKNSWHEGVIKSIQPAIVHAVWKQSGGSPLFAKSLLAGLQDSGQCYINREGHLASKEQAPESLSFAPGTDLQSLIIAQFDRLDQSLQVLLKVACVIGSTFSLEDVLFFLPAVPQYQRSKPSTISIRSGRDKAPWESGLDFITGLDAANLPDVTGDEKKMSTPSSSSLKQAVKQKRCRSQTAKLELPHFWELDVKRNSVPSGSGRSSIYATIPRKSNLKANSVIDIAKTFPPSKAKTALSGMGHGVIRSASLPNLQSRATSSKRINRCRTMGTSSSSVRGLAKTVEDIVNDLNPCDANLVHNIETMDIFGFLVALPDNDKEGPSFAFKSAIVRECIYSTMLSTQRQQLHLAIATYFERLMISDKRSIEKGLIQTYQHYVQTDDSQWYKKLWYLESVARYYSETGQANNAIMHYKMLMDMVPLLSSLLRPLFYDDPQWGRWHRDLQRSYFLLGKNEEAMKHAQQSLKLLGYKLPRSAIFLALDLHKQCEESRMSISKTSKNVWKGSTSARLRLTDGFDNLLQTSIWKHLTEMPLNGQHSRFTAYESDGLSHSDFVGLRYAHSARDFGSFVHGKQKGTQLPEEKVNQQSTRLSLTSIAELFLRLNRIKDFQHAILAALNLCKNLENDQLHAQLLSAAGMSFWMTGKNVSVVGPYIEGSIEALRALPNAGSLSKVMVLHNAIQYSFAIGRWKRLDQDIMVLRQFGVEVGDFQLLERLTRMDRFMRILGESGVEKVDASTTTHDNASASAPASKQIWNSLLLISAIGWESGGKESCTSGYVSKNIFPTLSLAYSSISNDKRKHFAVAYHSIAAVSSMDKGDLKLFQGNLSDLRKALKGIGPFDWHSLIGLFALVDCLFAAHDHGVFISRTIRFHVWRTSKKIVRSLKRMSILSHAEHLRYIYKGYIKLLRGKPRDAVDQWTYAAALPGMENFVRVRKYIESKISSYAPTHPKKSLLSWRSRISHGLNSSGGKSGRDG